MRPGGLVEKVSNDAAPVVAAATRPPAVVSSPAAERVVGHAVGPASSLPLKRRSCDKSYLVQEYLPPGAYARFVAGYPGVAALTVFVVLGAFVGIVQIPGYFAILEGDPAFPRIQPPRVPFPHLPPCPAIPLSPRAG